MCPSLPTGNICTCTCSLKTKMKRRLMSHSLLCFTGCLLFTLLCVYTVCVALLFLCLYVGISTNRSVRWDAAESSCHSPVSKLASFTFHFWSLERVWPEWSYHNVLSPCPVGHLTPRADTHSLTHAHMQLGWYALRVTNAILRPQSLFSIMLSAIQAI